MGGANAGYFDFNTFKQVDKWNTQLALPGAARFAGAASLIIWTTVITLGRFFAFL